MSIKPYTYIVRYDVAPIWTADGFILNDLTAFDMLSNRLSFADVNNELAASVLVAPSIARLESEQGYKLGGLGKDIIKESPDAYEESGDNMIVTTLVDAIELIDSVAFVRDENDNSQEIIEKLKVVLAKLTGESEISDIQWSSAD